MNDRLSKSDWLRHGLRTLAADGPGALKVAPLAAALAVSRGSFYWHFSDIEDFHRQLIAMWRATLTEAVIDRLEARRDDPSRFAELMRQAFGTDRSLDDAMRVWAAESEGVAREVAAVDARRIGEVARLLEDTGLDGERAAHRARFLYWAFLGRTTVADSALASLPPEALDEIVALFSAASG
jgi:AcrR family transcriptional regulator